jgi:hypothetical protein
MFYDKEEKKKREERFLASQGFVVFFLGGAAATNQTAIYLLPIRRPEFRIANQPMMSQGAPQWLHGGVMVGGGRRRFGSKVNCQPAPPWLLISKVRLFA